jgi:hypothetical protein
VLTSWLAAFAVTQAVEIPIVVRAQPDVPWPRRLLVAAGGSTLTHPVVWFVIPRLVTDWTAMVLVAETFAVLAEAAWFRAFGISQPLLWSLLANASSVAVGFALRAAFGWP